MPTIDLLLFGVLREQYGRSQDRLELAEPETLASLYARLFPPGAAGRLPIAYARNATYVPGDTLVEDGDEIAFLPPVGGG